MIIFKILGLLCYGFAFIDFAGMFFGYDLTGLFFTPIIFGLIGSVLMKVGDEGDEKSPENDPIIIEEKLDVITTEPK